MKGRAAFLLSMGLAVPTCIQFQNISGWQGRSVLGLDYYSNLLVEKEENDGNGGLQMDIMVPASGRNDRLKLFAERLSHAITDYKTNGTTTTTREGDPTISTFRLLITRFTDQEKADAQVFQEQVATLAGLPTHNVVMVHAPHNTTFSRARALNLMHQAACHAEHCLVAGMDVDLQIQPQFFHHSVDLVYLQRADDIPIPQGNNLSPQQSAWKASWEMAKNTTTNTTTPIAYFPMMWSLYNPKSVQLIELKTGKPLGEYSQHRGHFRDRSTGMYVLRGPDAPQLLLDTSFEGWGGEDGAFFQKVAQQRRIVRKNETGLIHLWHSKTCVVGQGGLTQKYFRSCRAARNGEEGSPLGKRLMAVLEAAK